MADEIIGRDGELDGIDRFLDIATTGSAGLVLEGEPGIGKTALWLAGLARAGARGMVVLRSRPAGSERSLALSGLTDLVSAVDDAHLERLPPAQREVLEAAFLRGPAGRPVPDQRSLSVGMASLLRGLAADGPVIVGIDDAQWLDDSSSAILAYAIRRVDDRPVGVLATIRADAHEPAARELIGSVPRDRLERLEVGPMPLAALHRLFLDRLGRSFPRLVLVRIEAASRGNPFFALELGRALMATDANLTPGDHLPVPARLADLVVARIDALPAPTRDALLLAAAAGQPTVEVLDRADAGAGGRLQPAIDGEIVAVHHRAIRFAHPLFAEAVVAAASPAALRDAHARLAEAVTSDEVRARHLGEAADGPDANVAGALAAAADHARSRGASIDAASLYEQARRLTPDDDGDRRIERGTLAAECLFIDVSDIVQADAILGAAIDEAPASPARAVALSLRAIVRYYHGQAEEAVRLAEEAAAAVGDAPLMRATVLGRLAWLVMQVDLDRGLGIAEEAVRLLEPAPPGLDPDLLANVLLLRVAAEFGLVHATRQADVDRAVTLISRDGRTWEHDGAEGLAFGQARFTDDLDTAIAMTEDLIHSKSGPAGDDPFNLVQLSGLQVLRGRWPEARASAEAALDGYRREGVDVFPSWGLRGVALVAAHDGRPDEARGLATDGLALAAASDNLVLQTFHAHILGFVALSLGDLATADAHLTAAARHEAAIGVRHPGRFKLDGDRLEVAIAVGDLPRARAIVEGLERAARIATTPWTRAIGARGAGLLRAADGDLDGAIAAMEVALREHEALPMPFERARTLLAVGRIHRRRKEKRLADERLREALTVFETLGAPVWGDLTRVELGRIGLRPRAPSELTETEQFVADLAASGRTSREIAELAFLTPKSVGNVLERVYLKLGIHSRAELGTRMAELRARPGDGSGRD